MAVYWNCDVCGKSTLMNPEYEVERDEDGTVLHTTTRQQNIYTGEIEDIPSYKFLYKQPKTYIVKLDLGGESIQKDFCEEHFNEIKPKLEEVYGLLRNIKSK